jgi:hypothetical protein
MLDLITTGGGISGTIPDTAGGGVFVGSSAPSSALTNKVWFAVDAGGKPISVRLFYNGSWRPVYSGRIGDVKLYFGAFNSVFDGTGKGIAQGSAVTPYDQEGWAICNGNNGTPNLEGYFPCGASWNGSAWVANPENTGGVGSGGSRSQVVISGANLPALKVPLMSEGGVFGPGPGTWALLPSYASPAPTTHYDVAVNIGGADNTGPTTPTGANTPLPIHLFFAMAYVMYIGY